MQTDISNMEDLIDVRDIIARVEELEDELDSVEDSDGTDGEERGELALLVGLLDELKGWGGDEQWKGYWYLITLIRDSYFEDYARELAEDIGAINADARWPNNCIDWEQAASELQTDYSSVEFEGVTYWYR